MASFPLIPRQREYRNYCHGNSMEVVDMEGVKSDYTYVMGTWESPPNSSTSLEDEPYYKAFSRCCDGNEVTQVEDWCLLWCEIPAEYVGEEASDTLEAFMAECFREARREEDVEGMSSQVVVERENPGEGAGVAVRPSVMGVLLLVTMLVYLAA